MMARTSKYLQHIALGVVLALGPALAAGQTYPTRPVTIVSPLATGGGADLFLRALAKEMQPLMGQPVLVESRAGGGGLIAGGYIARAKPDGYAIGDLQSPQVIPDVYAAIRKPPYAAEDLKFVVRVYYLPSALVSRADPPWRNMRDFVKYVQDNPGKINFAQTAGEGSPLHLLALAIFQKNRMQLVQIPFKGAGDGILALLGGHVDAGFPLSIAGVQGHVEAGRMSILAVDSAQRMSSLPDIPTLKELGFDPEMAPNYHVFIVPKGTPEPVVKKIHDSVKAALETPAIKEFARRNVVALYYGSENDILKELEKNRKEIAPLIDDLVKRPK